VDSHLQRLLNICSNFGEEWLIKFNSNKSNIITFGKPIFSNTTFSLNNKTLNNTNKITYLGVEINEKLDFDTTAITKFNNVSKSIFSLSYLGLTPNGVLPELKSFLYKTFCLSQFTYALETTTLKTKTRDLLNITQNNLIRQFIGLSKYCHISQILKCLKIYNFNELYIGSKLSFLDSIKNNQLSLDIFNVLCLELNVIQKNSISFKKDIIILQNNFNIDIELIFAAPSMLKKMLKDTFNERDGLSDSISTCLKNFNNKIYKKMLDLLTRPIFLQEHIDIMNNILI
jgi:hypothetical protein